jgi:hypothetical protein
VSEPIDIVDELQKVASLVTTARRLLATGTMVDLSALEGKVKAICDALAAMDRDQAQAHLPTIEALVGDLDRLSEALRFQHEPVAAIIEATPPAEAGPEG